MTTSVHAISWPGLIWGFVPTLLVVWVLFRWSAKYRTSLYALARMLLQLVLVGYVLAFIFTAHHSVVVLGVLAIMLAAAGWIALHPVKQKQPRLYLKAFTAIAVAALPILALVTQVIMRVDPWFLPRYVVPLAGMIFAGSMTAVSLAAERFEAECSRGVPYAEARAAALQAALIPIVNSLFAVGLVSLPGMMTGQILSGISPLVAARYQIVVMCMIYSASGLSAALFLTLVRKPD